MIRKSTEDDKEIVQELMWLCFGDRRQEPYENLDNRYYLYFEGSTLVAMTGLMYSKEYRNFEVDWTCTHPDYRHKGYMQELFKEMLKGVDAPVYCSCWRAPDKDRVNLHTIMFLFGFKEVIHSRVHWGVPYNCFLTQDGCSCTNYTGADCNCYEDLFLREKG